MRSPDATEDKTLQAEAPSPADPTYPEGGIDAEDVGPGVEPDPPISGKAGQ